MVILWVLVGSSPFCSFQKDSMLILPSKSATVIVPVSLGVIVTKIAPKNVSSAKAFLL